MEVNLLNHHLRPREGARGSAPGLPLAMGTEVTYDGTNSDPSDDESDSAYSPVAQALKRLNALSPDSQSVACEALCLRYPPAYKTHIVLTLDSAHLKERKSDENIGVEIFLL